jgi:hypothetical protein
MYIDQRLITPFKFLCVRSMYNYNILNCQLLRQNASLSMLKGKLLQYFIEYKRITLKGVIALSNRDISKPRTEPST